MLLALAVLALAAGARCAAVPPEATEAVAVATPATPAAEEQYGATPTAISEEASLRGVDADPQPQPPPAVRAPPNNSVPSASRRPCVCDDGQCSCCSGFVMQTLANFAPRQRGCLNVTYDPDDFAFAMALSFNDRVLYKNTVSAKNPRPVCVALPRVTGAKMCVRLYNVYFVGRNVHACFDMEAKWQDTQAFQMSFDCIRVGADGVKVVKPEAGAGLAVGVPVGATPAPDEYDEIPAEHPPEKPDGSSSSSSSKPDKPSKPSKKPKPPKTQRPSSVEAPTTAATPVAVAAPAPVPAPARADAPTPAPTPAPAPPAPSPSISATPEPAAASKVT